MMISKKLLLKEYDEHTTIKRQQMSTGDENSQPEGEGRRLSRARCTAGDHARHKKNKNTSTRKAFIIKE